MGEAREQGKRESGKEVAFSIVSRSLAQGGAYGKGQHDRDQGFSQGLSEPGESGAQPEAMSEFTGKLRGSGPARRFLALSVTEGTSPDHRSGRAVWGGDVTSKQCLRTSERTEKFLQPLGKGERVVYGVQPPGWGWGPDTGGENFRKEVMFLVWFPINLKERDPKSEIK